MKQVSLCLPDEQIDQLRVLSKKRGISRNELVRNNVIGGGD